jgi:tetratricopeptide (TPR) repeat protein
MNCIFRSYPTHPWFPGWSFEPQGCGTSFREKNAGYFFQTLETVGQIRPNLENPEWSIQIPIPQNSRINILSNGFCGYLGHKKRTLSAEVIVPEPGVLWGRFSNIPAPVLLSETDPENRDGFQWLESDTSPALLAIREDLFCLITKARVFDDAVQQAESYLEKDFEAALVNELERRAGAAKLFEQMNHHDSLAVISAESMMHALRPPEGKIPGIWSQSPESDSPHTNANELYALALAWRQLDIDTAEALVLTTLKTQGSSGAIPVICSPHQTFSILEAPKPLIAKTAEKVWQIRRNPEFLTALLPLLRRHLQWLLHHFDPKRRGLHYWQNSNEPLDPKTYASELATADLSTLLLTEIEALNRLRKAMPNTANEPDWFKDEQAALELNLQTQFWNEEKGQFCNAIARSRVVEILGIPSFIPLLWGKLPLHRKNLILEQIRESGKLPGGRSVLSWRKSALDDRSFPLFQQLLVLETLKTAAPNSTLTIEFTQVSLKGMIEWHTLALEEHSTPPIDPITAAYSINLQETHSYRSHGKGGISGWLFKIFRKTRSDWFEVAIVVSTIFTIWGVHTVYKQLHRPPPLADLLMRMDSAYANGNGVETLANSSMVIKYYPDQAARARLLTGNLLLLSGDYEQAAKLFEDVRREYPDSPAAMVSLGLAYQLQGNFEWAETNYAEFSYLFENIFPELVSTVQRYRYLMKEGFKKPPKWKEIYNYPDMHKL